MVTKLEQNIIDSAKSLRPTLRKVCTALRICAPVLTIERFGTLRHCYEVSMAASHVLKTFGFRSKVTQCEALILSPSGVAMLTGGDIRNRELVLDRALKFHNIRLNFPEETEAPFGQSGAHYVVCVSTGILDCTIGQVNSLVPDLIPVCSVFVESHMDSHANDWGEGTASVSWHPATTKGPELPTSANGMSGLFNDITVAACQLLLLRNNANGWCETLPSEFLHNFDTNARLAGLS